MNSPPCCLQRSAEGVTGFVRTGSFVDEAYVQTWPPFRDAGPALKSLFFKYENGYFSLLVASRQFRRLKESHATISLCDFRGKKSLCLIVAGLRRVCVPSSDSSTSSSVVLTGVKPPHEVLRTAKSGRLTLTGPDVTSSVIYWRAKQQEGKTNRTAHSKARVVGIGP